MAMYCSKNLSNPSIRDSGKVVCNVPKVDMAVSLNNFDNVKLSFFNIQISHVALVKDGESEWQCISL